MRRRCPAAAAPPRTSRSLRDPSPLRRDSECMLKTAPPVRGAAGAGLRRHVRRCMHCCQWHRKMMRDKHPASSGQSAQASSPVHPSCPVPLAGSVPPAAARRVPSRAERRGQTKPTADPAGGQAKLHVAPLMQIFNVRVRFRVWTALRWRRPCRGPATALPLMNLVYPMNFV